MTAIVDFVSMSWTPLELKRILDVAKTGAKLKSVKFFEFSSFGQAVSSLAEDPMRLDYKRLLSDMLDKTEFVFDDDTPKQKFNDVKNDLFNHFGLNTLDCLCRGEIERFVNRFNFELGQIGNEWTFEHRSGGFSGYANSANILVNGKQAGLAAWGAKNHGCYLSLSGVGCSAVDFERLHLAIRAIPALKITRVDLAHDSLSGKHNIKTARKMAKSGQFISKGRPCSYCYIESGHLFKMGSYTKESGNTESLKKRYGFNPDKGKSFYVGSRDAGKMLRVYEKGKQLDSIKHPNWVRWELELRSKDRVIPLDVLIKPADYLASSYPALKFVDHDEQCVIATNKIKYFTTVDNAIKNGSKQCGKLVNYLKRCMGYSDAGIITLLTGHLSDEDIPDRLLTPAFNDTEQSRQVQYDKPLSSWEDIYNFA
ncbi:replication initiation factor domain-containing protein [Photobacterium leiognathi]|uniref:replication initiation factor domain-containing protein n=1 Tax=Photobacterium leiognathi TaxID=553611 RepID=UPI0029815B20|nr:replication initiation factor domain-containing protein [Photobacterium leiognathi]